MAENRKAALQRLRDRVQNLIERISISANLAEVPESYHVFVAKALKKVGNGRELMTRNPGELYRQHFSVIALRLAKTAGENIDAPAYQNPLELIEELKVIEEALIRMKAGRLSLAMVKPLRWEVETFGFRTVSLDIRQNSTVINQTLHEIWHKNASENHPVPEIGSLQWSERLREELHAPSKFFLPMEMLSEISSETIQLFKLIGEVEKRH